MQNRAATAKVFRRQSHACVLTWLPVLALDVLLPYRPDLISFTSEAAIPKPTFQNIARLAGVGTATVERVLNGRGGVRPGLAEKVTAAAEETPRSMKTQRLCSKKRCGHEDREPVRGVLKR
jgi:hypothetical protein